jgi:hypothetical protein
LSLRTRRESKVTVVLSRHELYPQPTHNFTYLLIHKENRNKGRFKEGGIYKEYNNNKKKLKAFIFAWEGSGTSGWLTTPFWRPKNPVIPLFFTPLHHIIIIFTRLF